MRQTRRLEEVLKSENNKTDDQDVVEQPQNNYSEIIEALHLVKLSPAEFLALILNFEFTEVTFINKMPHIDESLYSDLKKGMGD